ncbi:MAG: hypothetical protein IKW13_03725 [Thermoguttaceae bacterium]|nr:hypothetical protein [Thermoguttaceae bacterium]
MTVKNLFGKIAGSALQAVGNVANVVGKTASAAGKKLAKSDVLDVPAAQPPLLDVPNVAPDSKSNAESNEGGFLERVAEAAEQLNPFAKPDDGLSDEDRAFLELLDLDALDEKDDEPDDARFGFFNVAQFFKKRSEDDADALSDPDYEAKKAAAAVPRRANLFRIRDLFIFDTFLTKAKKVYLYKSIKRVVLRSNVLMPPAPLPLRVLNSAIERSLDWETCSILWPKLFGSSPKRAAKQGFLYGAILGLPANKVPHFQIWIEMNNEDGETLMMTCDDKWISNLALKKFLTAVEQSGARPEIWRAGRFTGKLRQLRAPQLSRVRFTLRFSQKIGIFLLIYCLIAAIVDLCLN